MTVMRFMLTSLVVGGAYGLGMATAANAPVRSLESSLLGAVGGTACFSLTGRNHR